MTTKKEFQEQHDQALRFKESARILNAHPSCVLIFIEVDIPGVEQLEKQKFIVPGDMLLAVFKIVALQRLRISVTTKINMHSGDTILNTEETLRALYDKYKDSDGLLYVNIRLQPSGMISKLRNFMNF